MANPKPMTLFLTALVSVLALAVPLVPEPYRVFNFAAFGAVGLFGGARIGFWPGVVFAVVAKLLSDLMNYAAHGYDADYLPIGYVVLSFVVYASCGWLVRRTENLLAVGGGVVLGSMLFFLVTNFGSWVRQDVAYGYTFTGLWNCYLAGVPFYRGTFLSDVLFSGGLFGTHAVLSRVYFPAERVVPATVTVTVTDRN
jgi:hypothetical protein